MVKKEVYRHRGKRGGKRVKRGNEKENLGQLNGVFNLSSKELNKEELLVLNKGLKYVPKAKLNKFQTFVDIQKFTRQLCLKRHFYNIL